MKHAPSSRKSGTAAPNKPVVTRRWHAGPLFWLALSVLLTAVVYFPSLDNGWTNWDDNGYVLDNELVRTTDVRMHFTTFEVMGNYHPLTTLSLALDYAAAGTDARRFHVTNLLLHLAATAMVFLFLLQLFRNLESNAHLSPLLAAFGALVFGLHPMHVESVAWVSERKDVLYGFFFFASLSAWMRFIAKPGWAWYGLALLLFGLSLLSKGQAVTLPVVLVLIDWLYRRHMGARATLPGVGPAMLEKLPFFALALAFGVVAVMAQQESKAIQDIPEHTWLHRLVFAGYALFTYVWKFFAPVNLSAFYPYPIKGTLPVSYFVGLGGAIALLGLAIWAFRHSRWMWFGLLLFGANIILLLQLLPVGSAVVAERYTYVAYIGLTVMLAYVLVNGFPLSQAWVRIPRAVAMAFALGLLLFYAVQTHARIGVWRNSETLWTDVLTQFPYAPNAHNNLGSFYQKNNQLDRALYHFNTAIGYQADFPEALVNRSDVFRVRGELNRAIADASHVIRVKPDYEGAYMNRGIAYSMAGRYDSALVDFNAVLQMNPKNNRAYSNRGNLHDLRGNYEQALADYNRAIELFPGYEAVYGNRAVTLLKLKRYPEALTDVERALLNSPTAELYAIRADINVGLGRYGDALLDVANAQRLGKTIDPAFTQMLQRRLSE